MVHRPAYVGGVFLCLRCACQRDPVVHGPLGRARQDGIPPDPLHREGHDLHGLLCGWLGWSDREEDHHWRAGAQGHQSQHQWSAHAGRWFGTETGGTMPHTIIHTDLQIVLLDENQAETMASIELRRCSA